MEIVIKIFLVQETPETTQEPTTQESTTQEPTTQEPTTQKPTTQEPTTQEPTTQEPTTAITTTTEPGNPYPDDILVYGKIDSYCSKMHVYAQFPTML